MPGCYTDSCEWGGTNIKPDPPPLVAREVARGCGVTPSLNILLGLDGIYLEDQGISDSENDMIHALDPEPPSGPVDPS